MTNPITIRDDKSRRAAIDALFDLDLTKPWQVTIEPYVKRRTDEQNRLQRRLIGIIAEQLGDRTPEEVRGECKLTLGVPILRAENEIFREKYDEVVRPLSYPQKLALMMEPLDMPVTRLMTVKQKTQYLDSIFRHYAEMGVLFPATADDFTKTEAA